MCCEKGGHCGRQACMIWKWFHHGDIISGWVDLHMTLLSFTQVSVTNNILFKFFRTQLRANIVWFLLYHSKYLILLDSYYYNLSHLVLTTSVPTYRLTSLLLSTLSDLIQCGLHLFILSWIFLLSFC